MALELTQEQKGAGWQVKQLGELCTAVQSGGTPNRKEPSYYSSETEGIHWAKTQEIRDGRIYDTEEFISQDGLENSAAKIFPANTILIAMYGATVGRIGLLTKDMATNQAACALLIDDAKASYLYLYYHLFLVRDSLIGLANGAAQQNLNLRTIREFEIAVPPLEEQKRIAEILGSVDDKIEANSRLIQNLEELADLTFDSHLEDLSEVLEDTTYGSLNFFGGGTPNTKTPDYWDGEVNWVTPTDVTSLKSHTLFESSRKITEAGLAACSSKLHPAGSIMMTSRATIGRFAVNQVPAATNQGFIVVQPANEYERWWIYHSMKKDVELFLLLANGATFLELSRRVFEDIPLKMFHGKTELPAIHNQIIALEAENKGLIETRDLLIRHLIG